MTIVFNCRSASGSINSQLAELLYCVVSPISLSQNWGKNHTAVDVRDLRYLGMSLLRKTCGESLVMNRLLW